MKTILSENSKAAFSLLFTAIFGFCILLLLIFSVMDKNQAWIAFVILCFLEIIPLHLALTIPYKFTICASAAGITITQSRIGRQHPNVSSYRWEQVMRFKAKSVTNEDSEIHYNIYHYDQLQNKTYSVMPTLTAQAYQELTKEISFSIYKDPNHFKFKEEQTSFSDLITATKPYLAGFAVLAIFLSIAIPTIKPTQQHRRLAFSQLTTYTQEQIRQHLDPICSQSKYCLIGFSAEWCSSSKRSEALVPTILEHFDQPNWLNGKVFKTTYLYGDPRWEEEESIHQLQANLGLGSKVPQYIFLDQDYNILGEYEGGYRFGNTNDQEILHFLQNRMGIPEHILQNH